ncbi:ATP-dependent DNA helicase RecG [Anaerotignum neopropionicum]|uniref:ATP-dependent DNA helicase RecG n=1 Tax=Anaerotignum neopropionicum TaxID=36847 RepID=A0A136WG41_9FIRM|nr:ATP-dependent DNA helicase RecG [Anaerotignum neopropionicum]KXL53472.1 ATP-dependent DNA helicase RecG [Anaerotignum neopropionicum]
MEWKDAVSQLKGVGEQREKKLNCLGIYTIEDLLTHYPRDYKDRTRLAKILELEVNTESTFIACCKGSGEVLKHGRFTLTRLRVADETGEIGLLWYNQPYMKNILKPGEWYLFTGKLQNKYGRKEFSVTEWEGIGDHFAGGRIIPVYPSVEGISQKMLRGLMAAALAEIRGGLAEDIPLWIRKEYQLAERNFSIEEIHFPKTEQSFFDARRRLVFEEFFVLQGALFSLKAHLEEGNRGFVMKKKKVIEDFQNYLSFQLTNGQKKVLKEIEKDLSTGKQMNRLIQGDVGSGKTAVAMAVSYWVIQNGYQAVLMAPTEVLAQQHYLSFSAIFENLGITTVLLTGGQTAKEKRAALQKVASGEGHMIIGTHAVIQNGVEYRKLGIAITDEQHRFGVRQRGALNQKGENPHVLVMTATPIPRTLALILYGDLDISIIDELPPGRQKIDTMAVTTNYHERIYRFIEKEVAEGRQAYVICPMIEENEKLEVQSVLNYSEELQQKLNGCKVACVHGKMKPKEKQEIMNCFVKGEIHVLVSTTVIEVGINVPNAVIMLIENAERFGLAQLHQLRGRVGRGSDKSYCILVSDAKTKIAKQRLKSLTDSEDGFVISEMDLKLRGPGEFFGIRQHGLPELKIANIYEDMPILMEAQNAAKKLMAIDPFLSLDAHEGIRKRFTRFLDGKQLEI